MSESVIVTGLAEVVAAMQAGPKSMPVLLEKAVAVTSRKVQQSARSIIGRPPHLPLYAASITYDVTTDGDYITGEIGPDKDRPQGALGNLLEYGSRKNPPLAHLAQALEQNADDLERGITVAVTQALGL